MSFLSKGSEVINYEDLPIANFDHWRAQQEPLFGETKRKVNLFEKLKFYLRFNPIQLNFACSPYADANATCLYLRLLPSCLLNQVALLVYRKNMYLKNIGNIGKYRDV